MNPDTPLPCPFIVLVDSSEQHPWTYRGLSDDASDYITEPANPWTFEGLRANADKKYAPLVVNCRAANLMTGDYSICCFETVRVAGVDELRFRGFENYITIERKSLSDAFSTFTHDRERWERELERMRKIASCHVVIEGDWAALRAGPIKPGGANLGKAVFRSIMSWSIDFPHVHWWCMETRELAEATAFRLLEKFWEKDQWQIKQLQKLSIESESQKPRRRSPAS